MICNNNDSINNSNRRYVQQSAKESKMNGSSLRQSALKSISGALLYSRGEWGMDESFHSAVFSIIPPHPTPGTMILHPQGWAGAGHGAHTAGEASVCLLKMLPYLFNLSERCLTGFIKCLSTVYALGLQEIKCLSVVSSGSKE